MAYQLMPRRLLIKNGLQIAAVASMPFFLTACGKTDEQGSKAVCKNLELDPADIKEMRASFHYVDNFFDTEKLCSKCRFFTVGTNAKCGNCTVIGAANSMGHCDAFSEQP